MRKVRMQRECAQAEVSTVGVRWCIADFRWNEGLDLCESFNLIDRAKFTERLTGGGARQKTAQKRETSFYYFLNVWMKSDHTYLAA